MAGDSHSGEAASSTPLRPKPKSKRPHCKSRTGCVNCRKRRVKCDEQKPSCQSCVRRCATCVYTAPSPSALSPPRPEIGRASSRPPSHEPLSLPSFQTATSSPAQGSEASAAGTSAHSPAVSTVSAAASRLCSCGAAAPTSKFDGLGDLALLHHWTLDTSLTICRESGSADMWQRVFPEVGFEHPFVAHALLSLAALHLAHTSVAGRAANVAKAAEHHNEALLGFRQAVVNITAANSEALFILSLLSMIYVFGFLTQRGGKGPIAGTGSSSMSRKDLVLGVEWIPMIRGIEAVLYPTHEFLRFGRMQVILSLGNWDELEPPAVPDPGPDECLFNTREMWKDSGDAETYDRALHTLRRCWMFIRQFDMMDAATLAKWGYNRAWSGSLMFIHFAPDAYFTLLHQRQPPALVLFAYFGAFLHGITDYWFMEGLGKEIVEVVADLVGPYWRPWIAWPLRVVEPG